MSAHAEIIAELRRVLNERDEAREQLDLTKRELGRWVDRETKAVHERDSYQRQLDAIGDAIVTSITKRIEPRISRHPVTVVMAAGSLIAKIGEAIGCEFEDGDDLLEAVKELVRECDEARAACPDCAMWAERSARWHDDMRRAERERDVWRDKFHALNQTAGELCNACGWAFKIPGEPCRCEVVKERDEARAEADRWKRSCNVFRERDWPKAFQATVTSLEQEVSDAHEQLAKLRKLSKPWEGDAYRRGAEAMREVCAQWFREHDESFELTVDACHDVIADMPIPEET